MEKSTEIAANRGGIGDSRFGGDDVKDGAPMTGLWKVRSATSAMRNSEHTPTALRARCQRWARCHLIVATATSCALQRRMAARILADRLTVWRAAGIPSKVGVTAIIPMSLLQT